MEDYIPFIIFVVIGIINFISGANKKKADSAWQPKRRTKSNPNAWVKRNAYSATDNTASEMKKSTATDSRDENRGNHNELFKESRSQFSEEDEAASENFNNVKATTERASFYSDFLRKHGKDAIVISEILGKPKGWE